MLFALENLHIVVVEAWDKRGTSNTVQYSKVQSGYCCAVQLSAFSVMKMIFVSVLHSAQVERFGASCMRGFFLEIGFMNQNISY